MTDQPLLTQLIIQSNNQLDYPHGQGDAARELVIAAMEHVHDAILQDYTASDDAPVAEIINIINAEIAKLREGKWLTKSARL